MLIYIEDYRKRRYRSWAGERLRRVAVGRGSAVIAEPCPAPYSVAPVVELAPSACELTLPGAAELATLYAEATLI